MAKRPGRFELTIRVPGQPTQKKKCDSLEEIAELHLTLPNESHIWVYIPSMDMGYGSKVQRFELKI